MKAFWNHFLITLKLNLRNKQALIFGYCVPIIGVIAFGTYFKIKPLLMREIAQVLTICILGGACFGLPTALISEIERGVWRRYRLTPLKNAWLILSSMLARYLFVLTSGLLQIAIAMIFYGMPAPLDPLQMLVAFTVSAFAFLSMGLVIAMVVNSPLAVQGVGQMIFLPMLIIGGVGVPLYQLPPWAHTVAMFLPGYYSVRAMDSCMYQPRAGDATGLGPVWFHLLAMVIMGAVALFCGAKMFRWEPEQKPRASAIGWVLLALVPWVAIGWIAVAYKMVQIR
jgi:ABC-type multidrug transport system permease subunit